MSYDAAVALAGATKSASSVNRKIGRRIPGRGRGCRCRMNAPAGPSCYGFFFTLAAILLWHFGKRSMSRNDKRVAILRALRRCEATQITFCVAIPFASLAHSHAFRKRARSSRLTASERHEDLARSTRMATVIFATGFRRRHHARQHRRSVEPTASHSGVLWRTDRKTPPVATLRTQITGTMACSWPNRAAPRSRRNVGATLQACRWEASPNIESDGIRTTSC